jgi:hypothetical protein
MWLQSKLEITFPGWSGEVSFRLSMVWNVCWYQNIGEIKGLGAFSEYTLADEKICFKVPDSISSADAATVPLAAATAWLALFSKTCLNIKRGQSNPNPVLVWGGSSKWICPVTTWSSTDQIPASVGLYAIQLARIYSIPVVAICSPKHFDLCKNLGASHVFDYHDPTIILGIKSAVPNIEYVFDCIGNETSSTLASQTVWPEGGILCTVRPGKVFTENVENRVKVTDVLVWTAFLKDQSYKEFKWPVSCFLRDRWCAADECRLRERTMDLVLSYLRRFRGGWRLVSWRRTQQKCCLVDWGLCQKVFRCIEMGRSLDLRSCTTYKLDEMRSDKIFLWNAINRLQWLIHSHLH